MLWQPMINKRSLKYPLIIKQSIKLKQNIKQIHASKNPITKYAFFSIFMLFLAYFIISAILIATSTDNVIAFQNTTAFNSSLDKYHKVFLEFISTDGDDLKGLILNARITNLDWNTSQTINKLLTNNSLELVLKQGSYEIIINVDDPDTIVMDYYSGFELRVLDDLSITVFLQPVGVVRGLVVDEFGSFVTGAMLSMECGNNLYNLTTNSFGSFYAQLPEGNCLVMAKQDNRLGIVKVNITKGLITETNIKLEKTVKTNKNLRYYLLALISVAILLLLIIIILGVMSKVLRHRTHGTSKIKKMRLGRNMAIKTKMNREGEKQKIITLETLTQAQKTIIETLNQREKRVIYYLIENINQKTWFSKLSRETQIPKTSLTRVVKSLEAKKIVTTEHIGKALRLRLSEWFLEK